MTNVDGGNQKSETRNQKPEMPGRHASGFWFLISGLDFWFEEMESTELRAALEAILFVSNEPVTLDDLADAFSDEGREAVIGQLEEIKRILEANVGGFMLEQTAGGWRLATRAEHDPILKKYFAKKGESRLSMAALETLAIIGYRQPVTAPEVSDIRGVNSNAVIRTLLERRMIRVAGRKNVVGSPFLYRTTRDFLVHFGLNDIRDLPRLEEFGDLIGDNIGDDIVAAIAASEQASPAADAAALEVPVVDEAAATAEAEAELAANVDAVESSSGEQRE
jgi:segregation and condensation protein B